MFLFFAFGIFNFFLNLPEIFGKIAMCGVVGIERIFRGFGILPNKQNAEHFRKRVLFSYACSETSHFIKYGKEGKRVEGQQKIKDGDIVVKNPLFQELPTHEVTIKSGRTLYRFTGSYDGERSRNYVKAV